jgi:[acyl-carrier-protein] S-malonyltransferase
MAQAANQIGPGKSGQRPHDGQMVVVAEATHGPEHARLAAVGFNALGAMETTRQLQNRSQDPNNPDYWGAHAPFYVTNGFWPGQGGAVLKFYDAQAAILGESGKGGRLARPPILPLLDAALIGWGLSPDQGGKSNHAQLGIGIVNAMLESAQMALEGHGVGIQDLDAVAFHGTATPDTTTKEPLFLVRVLQSLGFKKGEKRIKATALKALLTHGLGVAGGQEAAVILYALRNRRFPGMFNVAGRDLQVPDEIQEWIDFSEGPADNIDVAMQLSEGFSGNNATLIFDALGDEGLEKLLRYRGVTPQHIRDLREAQAQKAELAAKLDRQLRNGDLSFVELLQWAAFKDRSSRGVSRFAQVERTVEDKMEAPLSEEAEAFGRDFNRLSFQSSRWVSGPLAAIRAALAEAGEDQFESEIERLDLVLDSIRQADPNAFFADKGLPHVIRVINRNHSALEILAASESVRRALDDFFNPEPIAEITSPRIEIDPATVSIPMPERQVVMSFPGQGAFDTEKRSQSARALYDSNPHYQRVIDEGHERLEGRYGYDLKRMLFEGSAEEFRQTRHQQPILAADELARAAIVRAHLNETQTPITVAYGDSLGLIPAAFEAGWFDTEADALEFVFLRAGVMAGLNPFGPEAKPMALISGYDEGRVRNIVRRVREELGTHVVVSKMNGVGKLVLSGDPAGIQLVQSRINTLGGKVTILPVSTPFHDSHYFADAADELLERARSLGIRGSRRDSDVRLIANSTGLAVPPDTDILEFLANEIAAPVDLVTSQQTASQLGGNVFLEVGPKAIVSNDVAASLGALEEAPPTMVAYISSEEKLHELFPI